MKLSVEVGIRVEFRRVVKNQRGDPGKVHATVNGVPVCGFIGQEFMENHSSGVESVTSELFVAAADPCTMCYQRVNGLGHEEAKAIIAAAHAA